MIVDEKEIQYLIGYIKSKSLEYKGLFDKTQVLNDSKNPEEATNRGTHTEQVANTARRVAEELKSRGIKNSDGREINPSLAELIGLCHDLGHTPFGHEGERQVNACISEFKPSKQYKNKRIENFGEEYAEQDSEDYMIFEHNEHSAEIVIKLFTSKKFEYSFENAYDKKLDKEILDYIVQGVLAHSTTRIKNTPKGIEQQAVRLSDKIASINTDIYDLLNEGILTDKDIPNELVDFANLNPQERIEKCIEGAADEYESSIDSKDKKYPQMIGQNPAMAECYKLKEISAGEIKQWGNREYKGIGNNEKETQGQIRILFDYYLANFDEFNSKIDRKDIRTLDEYIMKLEEELKNKEPINKELGYKEESLDEENFKKAKREKKGYDLRKFAMEYEGYPKEQIVAFFVSNLTNSDVRSFVKEKELASYLEQQSRTPEEKGVFTVSRTVARRVDGDRIEIARAQVQSRKTQQPANKVIDKKIDGVGGLLVNIETAEKGPEKRLQKMDQQARTSEEKGSFTVTKTTVGQKLEGEKVDPTMEQVQSREAQQQVNKAIAKKVVVVEDNSETSKNKAKIIEKSSDTVINREKIEEIRSQIREEKAKTVKPVSEKIVEPAETKPPIEQAKLEEREKDNPNIEETTKELTVPEGNKLNEVSARNIFMSMKEKMGEILRGFGDMIKGNNKEAGTIEPKLAKPESR